MNGDKLIFFGFAGDIAVFTKHRDHLIEWIKFLQNFICRLTKILVTAWHPTKMKTIKINDTPIGQVPHLKYLGSIII